MTRVKVCGITSARDGKWAAECGADAIGLMFAESARRIDAQKAREIIQSLPPFVTPVGVFAESSEKELNEIASATGVRVVQFYGGVPAEAALRLKAKGLKVLKGVLVGSREDLEEMRGYPADAFLLDTKVEGKYGGTGKTFDWSLAREAKELGLVILAGGLGPDNVAEAIRQVKPYAVDASTRLESEPRVKDPELVRSFIEAVKQAESRG